MKPVRLSGWERSAREKERQREDRSNQRDAVQRCRSGDLSGFKLYIKPLGEMNAEQRLGVTREEFRRWDVETTVTCGGIPNLVPSQDSADFNQGATYIPFEVTDARREGKEVVFVKEDPSSPSTWYWLMPNGSHVR